MSLRGRRGRRSQVVWCGGGRDMVASTQARAPDNQPSFAIIWLWLSAKTSHNTSDLHIYLNYLKMLATSEWISYFFMCYQTDVNVRNSVQRGHK